MLDKLREVFLLKHGVIEKYIVVHLLEGGQNSGKQLVFKKVRGSKQIRAVHGASLPREFERQDMKKIFNKKIKTRFPILFKRAVEFQMMKAKGRL